MQYQETDCLSNPQNARLRYTNTLIKPSLKSNLQRQQPTVTLLSLLITIVSLFFILSKINKQDTTLAAFQQIIQTLITDLADYKSKMETLNKYRMANQTIIKQSLNQNIEKTKNQTQEAVKTLNQGFGKVKQKINKLVEDQHKIIRENQLIKTSYLKPTQNKKNSIQSQIQPASSQQVQTWKQQQTNTQITLSLLQNNQKEQFHQKKIEWMKSMLNQEDMNTQKRKKALLSAQGNLHFSHFNVIVDQQLTSLYAQEYQRLNTQYKTQFYKGELPFCLVVSTYNNAKNFRYEYNLQSILNLDYNNYKVIIIDDASTDNTPQLIQKFLNSQPKQERFELIVNDVQMTAVPNIHKAITKFCSQNDIVVLIDGDDQLLGTQSLKVFNAIYQQKAAAVVYSNHIKVQWHLNRAGPGWSAPYTANQKKNNMYRQVDQKISHLRSFKASLFLKIAENDLKDDKGEWLRSTYDEVICLPILQMACDKVEYVDEYFYLYNFGIGTNDLMVDGNLQKKIANYIKFKKSKYHCLKQQ